MSSFGVLYISFQGCRINHVVKAEHFSLPFACSLSDLVFGSKLFLLFQVVLCSLKWSGHPLTILGESILLKPTKNFWEKRKNGSATQNCLSSVFCLAFFAMQLCSLVLILVQVNSAWPHFSKRGKINLDFFSGPFQISTCSCGTSRGQSGPGLTSPSPTFKPCTRHRWFKNNRPGSQH